MERLSPSYFPSFNVFNFPTKLLGIVSTPNKLYPNLVFPRKIKDII